MMITLSLTFVVNINQRISMIDAIRCDSFLCGILVKKGQIFSYIPHLAYHIDLIM